MTRKVFISYTRDDQQAIRELHDDLSAIGNNVFFDQELTGGQSWWSTLLQGIRDCDVFIPVVGDSWLESIPCQLETDYAQRLGKRFLPVVLGEVSIKLLPSSIAETQWVRYDHSDTDSILSLVKAINSMQASPPLPDPLPAEPSVPISYLTELREQILVAHDIPRRDQEVLLADFRRRVDGGRDAEEIRMLLQQFRKRDDLNIHVANEIDAMLASSEPSPSHRNPTTTYRPPTQATARTGAATFRSADQQVGPSARTHPPPPAGQSAAPTYAPPPPQTTSAQTYTPPQHSSGYMPPGQHGDPAGPTYHPPQHGSGHVPPGQHSAPGGAAGARAHASGPGHRPDPPGGSKITFSYLCSAIAVFFLPIVFGPIAMWLASSARKLGNPKGATAFNVAVGATIVGILLALMLLTG